MDQQRQDVASAGRQLNDRLSWLRTFVVGLMVTLHYGQKSGRKAKKVVYVRPAGATFLDAEGKEISVAIFFQKAYNVRIEHPGLPCIVYRAKFRDGSSRDCFVPMELCNVASNQIYKHSVPGNIMLAISRSRQSDKTAADRLKKIEGAYRDLHLADSDYMRNSSIIIDNKLLTLSGRRLATPMLQFGRGQTEEINATRTTRFQLSGKEFYEPATLSRRVREDLYARMLCLGMLPRSFRVDPHFIETSVIIGCNIKQLVEDIQNRLGGHKPDIIFALVPPIADVTVHQLKRHGDLALEGIESCGFATQFMRFDRLPGPDNKGRDGYLLNVLAKVNPKLGGVNWKISGRLYPWYDEGSNSLARTMIIGRADVSHATAGNSTYPSVCAVVSTVDGTYARYMGSSRVQVGGRGQGVIHGLADILEDHFGTWSQHHGGDWPERIVFYRDGAAESQLEEVTVTEALAKAQLAADQHPVEFAPLQITMVYAIKRHHIRFFPEDHHARDEKTFNCFPGSVFDEGMAHLTLFDFYLQSHKALQGTARPTRYIVALNESNYNTDQLQQLTFDLCLLYARATQSVSIPAPVYYADLLCARHKYNFEWEYDFYDVPADPVQAAQHHAANFFTKIHKFHREGRTGMYFL